MSAQIVLLMAGAGSRFTNAGFRPSKPLIRVGPDYMFVRALSSLDGLERDDVVTYVVRQQQVDEERIDEVIRATDPDARIVVLPRLTSGAAESALVAIPALRADRPVVVLDCDLWFSSRAYIAAADAVSAGRSDAEAVLLTFEASDPRFSFVRVGDDGLVTEIAEKVVISNRAVAGAYFFASASTFTAAAATASDAQALGGAPEFYMSEVVKALLAAGSRVAVADVDDYRSFGTPEELDAALRVVHA